MKTRTLKIPICIGVFSFLFNLQLHAQVGIGTTTPEAGLDISSPNAGVLIPRVSLGSLTDNTTVINPNGGALAVSTLVYNTGTGGLAEAGFFFWNGSSWTSLREVAVNTGMQFYSWDIANTNQPNIDNPRNILDQNSPPLLTPDLGGAYTGNLTSGAALGTTNPAGNSQGFIICFVGTYEVLNGGVFNFDLTSDDGSRLYIDNVLIVENWFNQGSTTRSGNVNLAPGKHRFEFWYYEDAGQNTFSFNWGTNPDGNSGVISASQFTVE